MTDDDVMRGLLAAFYMQGGRALCTIQRPPDMVDAYVATIPQGYRLITEAEGAEYIETIAGGPEFKDGFFVVTEKGRKFFEGEQHANVQIGVPVPPGGADDET